MKETDMKDKITTIINIEETVTEVMITEETTENI